MLPPVRAALSSTADYSGQAQAAVTPARVAVSPNNSQSQTRSDATLSGGRLDAASLSAQLKLAQGSSIFAETIGKLLKTPRRENETLVDYTTRLFEAVQALKPQEIANVERLLNQIVKGISLRLMAEILKEPTGPAAARLAAHIEVANIAQRDLAAKTVVSFYRQNASAEAPLNGNIPRVPQGGNQGTALPPNQAGQPLSPSLASSPENQIASARLPVASDSSPKVAEGQNQQPAGSQAQAASTPASLKPDQPVQAQKPADSRTDAAPTQTVSSRTTTMPGETAAAAKPATAHADFPDSLQPGAVRSESNPGKSGVATPVTGNQSQVAVGQAAQQAAAAEPEEMQALARTAMEMFKLDIPVPARLWSALSDQTLLKLANWLATALSELDLPETAHLLAASPAAASVADGELSEQQRSSGGQSASTSAQSPQTAVPAQAAAGDRPEAARMAAAISRADTAEQQMAVMTGAVATLPTQAREALPWPYVAAYPPSEDEPRQEQRKAQPIEAIEDEEENGSSQQHAFGDDEQQPDDAEAKEPAGETMTAAEKAAGYRAGEAGIDANAPLTHPNDLYWRMAGWT